MMLLQDSFIAIIEFHERTQRTLTGTGQGPLNAFKKSRLWVFAISRMGLKIKIFEVLVLVGREGVTKKSSTLYVLCMCTIMDVPSF